MPRNPIRNKWTPAWPDGCLGAFLVWLMMGIISVAVFYGLFVLGGFLGLHGDNESTPTGNYLVDTGCEGVQTERGVTC